MRPPLVLPLLIGVAVAAKSPFASYVEALRRDIGLSQLNANHSATREPGTMTAMTRMEPHSLLLVVPPKYVITTQEALASVRYINTCTKKLPRTLPRHFVLAAWVLQELTMGRLNGVWRSWFESLLPMLDPTSLWSDSELDALQDERVIRRARALRNQRQLEYDSLVRVLLEECGMGDDLPSARMLNSTDYFLAAAVVTRYAWHFSADFPVLVPLSIRTHPEGSVDTTEWGTENDPGAAVYVGERALLAGEEITAWSEDADNTDFLLHAGHVWDDLYASRRHLLLSAGAMRRGRDSTASIADSQRDAWLQQNNWTRSMEFELDARELNPEMLAWLRLVFASPEELQRATSPNSFQTGDIISLRTEEAAFHALNQSLDRELGLFETTAEEDDELLEHARLTRKERGRARLSPRIVAAVTYRRLVKRILIRNMELASEHWREFKEQRAALNKKTVRRKLDAHARSV